MHAPAVLRIAFAVIALVGFALTAWSSLSNRQGGRNSPDDQPGPWILTGPYRFLSHPMYVGEWLMISGLAGYAAGFWNFLAVGTVAELLLRDWTRREQKWRKQ